MQEPTMTDDSRHSGRYAHCIETSKRIRWDIDRRRHPRAQL